MAQEKSFRDIQIRASEIGIRKIGLNDLFQALWEGYDDFKAKPSHPVFLFILYLLFALLLARFWFGKAELC